MASDQVTYSEASTIAQAIKAQLRTGKFWDELTPAAKETFDQIATACARSVSGDGAHWDGIIAFAHAAKPGTDDLPTVDIERDIRQMIEASQ